MYTCLNKFRDISGNIIGYTLISPIGIQYIKVDELRELLKEHKIYVSNLRMENGRIMNVSIKIQKACDYISLAITKDRWIPGGIMYSNKTDHLREFYIKFDMLVSKGGVFARDVERKIGIGHKKICYPDTMDCIWIFNNGVNMLIDKNIGKLIIYGNGEKFEIGEAPLQIIETKLFGGYT